MHRFFVDDRLQEGMFFVCSKELHHQLFSVLKLKNGERLVIFNGSGPDFIASIFDISKKGTKLLLESPVITNKEPKRKLILFQSMVKKNKFELVLEKGVEVGVFEFVPILAQRSIKKDFQRERAEKIIKEAAEQSGRSIIPKLRPTMYFNEAVEYCYRRGFQTFFASLDASHSERTTSFPSKPHVALFIGPEGGWNYEEMNTARKAGFLVISLGKLALKSETAAIVAAYQLLH